MKFSALKASIPSGHICSQAKAPRDVASGTVVSHIVPDNAVKFGVLRLNCYREKCRNTLKLYLFRRFSCDNPPPTGNANGVLLGTAV